MLAMVVFLLAVAMLSTTPSIAQQAGRSELTIRVDLDGSYIEVVESFAPTPPASSLVVRIPPTATDFETTGRIVERSSNGASETIEIALGGSEASIRYRVPDDHGVAGGGGTTVAADMVALSLWPNMDKVDVRIELPVGFSTSSGSFVEVEIAPDIYRYTLDNGDFERLWGLRFVALSPAGLNRQVVDLAGGARVDVVGRFDDREWLTYAAGAVRRGVPTLVDLVGQPWPASRLEVVESDAPDEVGYGGWYDLRRAQIEVDDEQDPELLLHELSHAWFNDTLFEHRWMIEGFAEAYAQVAAIELGEEPVAITEPGAAPTRFNGLNRWRNRFFFEDNMEEELYGYRASGYVVAQLMDEIGVEPMAGILGDMAADRHPYAVATDRRAVGLNDWRRLLDLVELEGGSTVAEDLFRRYVVTEGQEALLDLREEALEVYRSFEDEVAGGDRAQVPEGIRYAMSGWEFEAASRGVDRARAIEGRIDALAGRAEALELDLPAFLADTYLSSDVGFTRLSDILDDTDAALIGLEAKSGLSETDRLDFQLGRFDRMDLSGGHPAGPALNQGGGDHRSPWRWYLGVVLVVTVLLLGLARLAAGLPPSPSRIAGDSVPIEIVPGTREPDDDDEPPIYRPKVPVPGRGTD